MLHAWIPFQQDIQKHIHYYTLSTLASHIKTNQGWIIAQNKTNSITLKTEVESDKL